MNMMRHCRQCRADAVGLLGEDRGDEFTMDKIDAMEIDYEAAMVRAEVRPRRDHREARRQARHTPPNRQARMPRPQKLGIPAGGTPGADGGGRQERPRRRALRPRQGVPDLRGLAGRRALHRATARPMLYCGGDGYLRRGDVAEPVLPNRCSTATSSMLEGCEVVLCSKIGYEPWGKLEAAGIAPNGEHAMEPIEEAVMAVYKEIAADRQVESAARLKPERSPEESPWPCKSPNPASIAGPASTVCPNEAIYEDKPHFLIDDGKCTECLGDHGVPNAPRSARSRAIVDELGVA
jgi:nitrogen fixation protein NifB